MIPSFVTTAGLAVITVPAPLCRWPLGGRLAVAEDALAAEAAAGVDADEDEDEPFDFPIFC